MSQIQEKITGEYRCRPAGQGLFVYRPEAKAGEDVEGFFLPEQVDDIVLPQPDLPFSLGEREVRALTARNRPFAMTWFGPPDQSKNSNQDFALSASCREGEGQPWFIVAVADGVGTKTFWPERASRAACLVAFRTMIRLVETGFLKKVAEAGEQELGFLEEASGEVVVALRKVFEADRKNLLASRAVPPHFDPELYALHQHELRRWFNTTLQVAAVGPNGGVLLYVGDGGVWAQRPSAEPIVLLESGANSALDRYVSFGLRSEDLEIVRLGPGEIQLVLATDGLDRSLRMQQRNYGGLLASVSTDAVWKSDKLIQAVKAVYGSKESMDLDNVSLAVVEQPSVLEPYPKPIAVRVSLPAIEKRLPVTQLASVPEPEVERGVEGRRIDTGVPTVAPKPLTAEEVGPDHANVAEPAESDLDPAADDPIVGKRARRRRHEPAERQDEKELDLPPANDLSMAPSNSRYSTFTVLVVGLSMIALGFLAVGQLVRVLASGSNTASGAQAAAGAELEEGQPEAEEESAEKLGASGTPREPQTQTLTEPTTVEQTMDLAQVEEETEWSQHPRSLTAASLLLSYYYDYQLQIDQGDIPDGLQVFLDSWREEILSSQIKDYTVVAYADRENETAANCRLNFANSTRRASLVSEWLQEMVGSEYVILPQAQVCYPPPDVVSARDKLARRIVLVEGRLRMKCNCSPSLPPSRS